MKFINEEILNQPSSHPAYTQIMAQPPKQSEVLRTEIAALGHLQKNPCMLFPNLCALQKKFPPEILWFSNSY